MESTITIPAKVGDRDGALPIFVTGEVFACISATDEFFVQLDNGGRQSARKGSTLGNPGAAVFRRLTFFNTTATAIDLTFYAGSADNRPNTPLAGSSVDVELHTQLTVPGQLVKTAAIADGPTKFSVASLLVTKAVVYAKKSLAGTANVGVVNLGVSAVASEQPLDLNPNGGFNVPIEVGQHVDLANWYFAVDTDNDGIVVFYTPA